MHFHLETESLLAGAAAWCGTPGYPIAGLLLLTGLVGGLAHCGPMCGPFVLTQAAAIPAGLPVLQRLAGGLLLPYHLGRIFTYTVLGAAAAGLGGAVAAAAPLRAAVAGLLIAAAVLFAVQAASRLGMMAPAGGGGPLSVRWAGGLAEFSRGLLIGPSPARRFALGAVLGLLPCGFLYGALAAAAATQSALAGAVAMAGFGLGTVPSLFLVGIGGASLAAKWRRTAGRALGPLLLVNAAVLVVMAFSLAASP